MLRVLCLRNDRLRTGIDSQLADEQAAESWLARLYSGEFDLAGSDGRFYKGRALQAGERASDTAEDFKLPPLRQGASAVAVRYICALWNQ